MARRRGEPRSVKRVRLILVGAVGVVAIAVIGVGIWSAIQPAPREPRPGRDYAVVANPLPTRGAVTVTEFFSYGCIHCRRFDPQLEDWREDLPEDVRFERAPVVFNPAWRALAQAYYAARELGVLERNHERIFRAIHDQGMSLATPESIAAYVDGHGTDRETFLREMGSPEVRRAVAQAMDRARRLGIRAVPTLVVDGRWRVEAGERSRRQMLAITEELVARARAEARGAASEAEGARAAGDAQG